MTEINNLEKVQEIGLKEVEEIMKGIAERTLKREGTWVEGRRIKRYNRQLEELIKERRKLNKKRRKAETNEERRRRLSRWYRG